MKVNIIIIGAKNNVKSINELNNPRQARHYDLLELKKIIKDVNITCLDSYDKSCVINNINYFNDFFELGNDKYFDINSHNIVIDFCNMLNENFVNYDNNNQNDLLTKYTIYKFTWLYCGCLWSNNFPLELITTVVKEAYYTCVNSNNIDSYINAIINTDRIISNNIEKLMQPYSQGVYQSLGTVLYRGCSSNYSSENILLELFTLLNAPLNREELLEFNNFLEKNIHWNRLNRNIRLKLSRYIYGANIILDT